MKDIIPFIKRYATPILSFVSCDNTNQLFKVIISYRPFY